MSANENIFEKASRFKLRFDLSGLISVEQLWNTDMALLANYEQELTEVVESYGKSTRRSRKNRTKEQELNSLRLQIVTYILDVREAEEETARTAAEAKEKRQEILALIQEKKKDALRNMTVEELEKLL